jgi:hypothetical protein
MKIIFTLASLFYFSTSFSQWTRVQQLSSTDIASLYHKDNVLYAGGKNIIYISRNNGLTWDSTSSIPQLFLVTSIIVYKNELYAAAPHKGVFKSPDGGATWQDISAGIFSDIPANIFPDVSDFCEFRGDLYASTFGSSVYKLNPVNGNTWLSFSNGLSNLSANLPSIASNSNAIIAGTLANGIYAQLPANSTTWEERLLAGQLDPNEGAYDIVTAHDTLFYSGSTGKFYMSVDNGLNWNFIGSGLASAATTLANAKQALLLSRHIFESGSFKVLFYYIKKDALQNPFVNFSVVSDNHFTYKIDILGDKLWDASNKGLFYMPLSDLPGISSEDDSVSAIILPVRFISFNANCEGNKISLTWKTAQEQHSNHFTIERSMDAVLWKSIADEASSNKGNTENSYSFTDKNVAPNAYYRIAEHGLDGAIHYSIVLQASCKLPDAFNLWPNPFHDLLFVNVFAEKESQAIIKIFDSKGSLVKMQKANFLRGNNGVSLNMKFFTAGVYHLSLVWENGQNNKTMQIIKR